MSEKNKTFALITTGLAYLKEAQNPEECLYHIYNYVFGKLSLHKDLDLSVHHYDREFDRTTEATIKMLENDVSNQHQVIIKESVFNREYYDFNNLRELMTKPNYLILDFAHILYYRYDAAEKIIYVSPGHDQNPIIKQDREKLQVPYIKAIYIPIWDCNKIGKLFENFDFFAYDSTNNQVTTYIEKLAERTGIVEFGTFLNPILPPDFYDIKETPLMRFLTDLNISNNQELSKFLWHGTRQEKKQIPTNWRELWLANRNLCIKCKDFSGKEENFGLCSVCRKKYGDLSLL